MKTLTTKLLSIVFIFALLAGCASSVTGPEADAPQDLSTENNITPPNPDSYGDTEVKPILPKPTEVD